MEQKKLLIVAAVAVVAAVAAAGIFWMTQTGGSKSENVTLNFWHTYGESEVKVVDNLVADFESEHSGISIEMQYLPYDQLHEKMLTTLAAGKGTADIARYDMTHIAELADMGVLLPLDNYIDESTLSEGDFFPGPWSSGTYKGNQYGLPLDTNTRLLFYRKDMLSEAGVEPPETWEDLVDVAKQLTVDNDGDGQIERWGYMREGVDPWHFGPWLWQAGGEFLSSDQSRGALDSTQAKEALNFWKGLVYDHKVSPTPEKAMWSIEAISTGKAAMGLDGPWGYNLANQLFGLDLDKLGVAVLPNGPSGNNYSVVGGQDLVVSKFTEHPDAAFEFARYMLTYDYQTEMLEKADTFPTLKEASTISAVQNDPVKKVLAQQLEMAKARPVTPEWPRIKDTVNNYLDRALRDKMTTDNALNTANEEINEILQGE